MVLSSLAMSGLAFSVAPIPHVPSRPLRSSHAPRLAVPRTRTVFASRGFSVAASTVWNSLPDNVVNSDTLATFKKRLKTHLVMWNVLASERLCIFYYGAIQVLSLYCIVCCVILWITAVYPFGSDDIDGIVIETKNDSLHCVIRKCPVQRVYSTQKI